MKIIEGDLVGSLVKLNHDNATLEVHARLLIAKVYRLPQDISTLHVLTNQPYHSFEQWLIMIVLSLTVVGLLISIPMYFLAKKQRFTVRFIPKHANPFVIEGNGNDWKELKPYLPKG